MIKKFLKKQPWFRAIFGSMMKQRADRINRHQIIYSSVVLGGRLQLKPQNLGATFWVNARSDLAKRVILGGSYEPELCDVIRSVWAGSGRVVNVGANIGFWSIGLLNLLPNIERVFAIEPNPDAMNLLRENIELNNAGGKVTPIQACVSREEGSVEFETVPEMPEYSSIGRIIHPAVEGMVRKRLSVSAKPLDKILGADANGVELVLIDTEGAEYLVLSGAVDFLRKHRPVVIFECYNPFLGNFGHSVKQVRDLLHEIGYSVINAEPPHNLLPDDFEGEALAFPKDKVPKGLNIRP
jgi:FkbM family methyltransferase